MFSKSRIKPSCFRPTNEMCHVDKNKNQVYIKYVDAVINDDVLDIKLALREDGGGAEGGWWGGVG